jgi:hypothetical protein
LLIKVTAVRKKARLLMDVSALDRTERGGVTQCHVQCSAFKDSSFNEASPEYQRIKGNTNGTRLNEIYIADEASS